MFRRQEGARFLFWKQGFRLLNTLASQADLPTALEDLLVLLLQHLLLQLPLLV